MTPLQKITLRLESMEKITEMMLTTIDKQNAAIGAIQAVIALEEVEPEEVEPEKLIVVPH